MPELAQVETPKNAGLVNRGVNYETRKKRLENEEEELKKLESGEEKEEVTEEKETDTEVKEETLSAEERSFKKRYGDLRRHFQQKEKEWEEKIQAIEERSAKQGITPPKSDQDIEEWAKEYPDVAGIVETIAAKKAQEMFNKADARLKEIDEVQYEAQRVKAEAEIQNAHSDFFELRASDDFHGWADEQPKWVRDALYENSDDPASVIRVIDLYKSDKGMTKDARKEKNRAAASVVSKANKAKVSTDESEGYLRESQVAKMSDKQFEKQADEINEAIRSGKFIYDISGSAR